MLVKGCVHVATEDDELLLLSDDDEVSSEVEELIEDDDELQLPEVEEDIVDANKVYDDDEDFDDDPLTTMDLSAFQRGGRVLKKRGIPERKLYDGPVLELEIDDHII